MKNNNNKHTSLGFRVYGWFGEIPQSHVLVIQASKVGSALLPRHDAASSSVKPQCVGSL